MKKPEWKWEAAAWDRFKAFYMCVSQREIKADSRYGGAPMVVFDTGEVIFTNAYPRPGDRGYYSPIDVTILTSKELTGELYAPDGQKIAIAWLYDGGQVYLLHDHSSKRIVALSGWRGTSTDTPVIEGVPQRFQHIANAYIPGEGVPPVPMGKIKAWLPFNKAGLADEEKAHIQMIIDTARAALKLTDHEACRGYTLSKSITGGCPLDAILAATTWQDIPAHHLRELYHHGAQRKKVEYDYLLTEKP